MKLTEYKNIEVESTEDLEGQDFSIDMDSIGILIRGFSDSLYSNKIGSIVREITSNCFDSHEESGNTKPVRVQLREADPLSGEQASISFIDYGVGLSPDRIKKIYSKYFASTKRDTNDQIGGFGIGAKSPLAYTDSFLCITVFGGVQYTYIIHKGLKVPRIELVDKTITDKDNGTEIKILIEDHSDYRRFKDEVRSQLKYFDNVDYVNCGVSNDYKIIQGKHFIYRSGDDSERMGVCIGKVAYPLDYSQLEISQWNYRTPISLRFEIGELTVTMNRENIEYTKGTKEVILKRLEEAELELQEIYDSQLESMDDLKEFIQRSNKANDIQLGESVVNGADLIQSKQARFTPFIDMGFSTTANTILDQCFRVHCYVKDGKKYDGANYVGKSIRNVLNGGEGVFRIVDAKIQKRKNLYISDKIGKSGFWVLKMSEEMEDLDILKAYAVRTAMLTGTDPEAAQKILALHKYMVGFICEHSESYDRTDIPDFWLEQYKTELASNAKGLLRDSKETITLRVFSAENSGADDSNFKLAEYKASQIAKILDNGQKIIYGSNNESEEITHAGGILQLFKSYEQEWNYNHLDNEPTGLIFCKIAQANAKKFKDYENFIHIDEFWQSNPKLVSKVWAMYESSQRVTYLNATIALFSHKENLQDMQDFKLLQKFCASYESIYYWKPIVEKIYNYAISQNLDSYRYFHQGKFIELKATLDRFEEYHSKVPFLKHISHVNGLDELDSLMRAATKFKLRIH